MGLSVVMENASEIKTKMQFTGTVIKTSLAGALIDIGTGTPALIHISQLVSPTDEPIKGVEDVLKIGQNVDVWVRKVKDDRVELTMIKPLDLEWRDLKQDMVVKGKVVRLEKFGAFVEIGAERPGLVHISEMAHGYVRAPEDVVKEGDEVEAQVLEINRKKKQIKLSMKALLPEPEKEETPRPAAAEKKEKTNRRSKKTRGESRSDFSETAVEAVPTEPDPTAMEIALRTAMDRAKVKKSQETHKKARSQAVDQDDILSRTLENKVQHA